MTVMEGHAVISHDVLAPLRGRRRARGRRRPRARRGRAQRHHGVKVTRGRGRVRARAALALELGRRRAGTVGAAVQRASPTTSRAWPKSSASRRRRRRESPPPDRLSDRAVAGLTARDARSAPSVCHDCVWWQSRGEPDGLEGALDRAAEDDWGDWGTLYRDDDGRLLGSMQYGPAQLFPRAADLPAGPPSDDAVLVTCAYLVAAARRVGREVALPRGDRRGARPGREGARGVRLPLPGGRVDDERFLVHRTVFPRDFLDDFGFRRSARRAGSSSRRLELGGLAARRGGQAREGAAGRPGGVHAGAVAVPRP